MSNSFDLFMLLLCQNIILVLMEISMSYYHILIEVNDHISTIEQTRDIEILDIQDLSPYLHSILIPYFNEHELELEDENLAYNEVLHLEIKQTLLPIEHLIEEEQKQLRKGIDKGRQVFNKSKKRLQDFVADQHT